MNARSVVMGALLALVPLVEGYAQDTQAIRERWNPEDETPVVKLWPYRNTTIYRPGEYVRMRFQVEEDAYVAVVRVDGNGRLSLLWPRNPRARALVTGGKTTNVDAYRGHSFATSHEQGPGYVFAIASFDPIDLTMLSRYDGWTYRASFDRPYYGSPERIVQRLASQMLYDENSAWDYDVYWYNVDAPGAVGWNSWNSQCSYLDHSGFGSARYGYGGFGPSEYCNPQFAHNRFLWYSGYCSAFSIFYGGYCSHDPLQWINRPAPTPANPPPASGFKKAIIERAAGRPFIEEGTKADSDPQATLERQRYEARRLQDDRRIATGDGATWAPNEEDRVYSIPQRVMDGMRRQDAQRRGSIATQAIGQRDPLGGARTEEGNGAARAPTRGADFSSPQHPTRDRTDIGGRQPLDRDRGFDRPTRDAPMREAPRRTMDSPAMIDRRQSSDEGRVSTPGADNPRTEPPRTNNPRMEAAREAPRYTPPPQVTPAQVSPPRVTPITTTESGSKGESGEKKPR